MFLPLPSGLWGNCLTLFWGDFECFLMHKKGFVSNSLPDQAISVTHGLLVFLGGLACLLCVGLGVLLHGQVVHAIPAHQQELAQTLKATDDPAHLSRVRRSLETLSALDHLDRASKIVPAFAILLLFAWRYDRLALLISSAITGTAGAWWFALNLAPIPLDALDEPWLGLERLAFLLTIEALCLGVVAGSAPKHPPWRGAHVPRFGSAPGAVQLMPRTREKRTLELRNRRKRGDVP